MKSDQHGTRARYTYKKCRCVPCTEANSLYNANRRRLNPGPNPLVDSNAARFHLKKLQKAGIGLRSIQDVTGIRYGHLGVIRRGQIQVIKTRTERLILSVTKDAYAGGARIRGNETAMMIKRLRIEGFTYNRLAKQVGLWPETLQRIVNRKRNVQAITKMKIEKFYNRLNAAA